MPTCAWVCSCRRPVCRAACRPSSTTASGSTSRTGSRRPRPTQTNNVCVSTLCVAIPVSCYINVCFKVCLSLLASCLGCAHYFFIRWRKFQGNALMSVEISKSAGDYIYILIYIYIFRCCANESHNKHFRTHIRADPPASAGRPGPARPPRCARARADLLGPKNPGPRSATRPLAGCFQWREATREAVLDAAGASGWSLEWFPLAWFMRKSTLSMP